MEFDYPIDYSLYSTSEITIIIKFLDMVEQCYEGRGVKLEDYKETYKQFKTVVRTKSEENNLLREYKKITDFDGYQTTQEMKKDSAYIKL